MVVYSYFVRVFIPVCVLISHTQGMHDGFYDNQRVIDDAGYFEEDPTFRYSRNTFQGRYPQNNGARFGWQNPIRVAPTLRPPNSYPVTQTPQYARPTRTTTSQYSKDPLDTSGSNEFGQYVEQPQIEKLPGSQPQKGCSKDSRMDKQTGNCISLGSSCGENMAFYEDPTAREYGECDCLQHANRPLVYHPQAGKCFFVFQQAFCKPNEWLIVDGRTDSYSCSINPCRQYIAESKNPNWNWASNDLTLNRIGPVALLKERKCSLLGSACGQPGNEQIALNIEQNTDLASGIRLAFQGSELVCRRETEINEIQPRKLKLACRSGLFNKWKLEGRCGVPAIDARK